MKKLTTTNGDEDNNMEATMAPSYQIPVHCCDINHHRHRLRHHMVVAVAVDVDVVD